LWVGCAYLVVHGLLALLLPESQEAWSTLCIVLAELAALFACLYTARSSGTPSRTLWRLLALSIFFHAIAMSMDMYAEYMGIAMTLSPGIQILCSTLYAVPLLFAVSMQFDARTPRPVHIVNACLALATAALFYVLVFSVVSRVGSNNPADLYYLSRLFDVLDLFLAIAATIRAAGVDEPRQRQFFYVISAFLWINALFPAIHNRILIRHDYVWLDLLISAPYVLLLVLIFEMQPDWVREIQPSPTMIRIVRSGCPIFLSLGLLLLGIEVSRIHFYTGGTAIVLAIVGYGAVNVLTQARDIETEESLLEMKRSLEHMVGVDDLTGIANRRTFDQRIELECRAVGRSRQPFSLLMIDVDYFKQLNDANGHLLGDEYLIQIAHGLQNALPRANDFIARYGGEEFAVLLPMTGSSGAAAVAKNLHTAIAALHMPHPAVPAGRITISIGCATSDPSGQPSPNDLIHGADRALYRAKARGRNRTEIHLQEV